MVRPGAEAGSVDCYLYRVQWYVIGGFHGELETLSIVVVHGCYRKPIGVDEAPILHSPSRHCCREDLGRHHHHHKDPQCRHCRNNEAESDCPSHPLLRHFHPVPPVTSPPTYIAIIISLVLQVGF